MKKLMVLSLLASSVLALSGCGSTEKSTSAKPESSQATTNNHTDSAHQDHKAVQEIPIGDSKEAEGMEISAVYFEAADMFPEEKAGIKASDADIHLEADIKATKENKVGFGAGEWVPYLTVNYKVKNLENGKELAGTLMPMNAQDGPHYGANLKMPGAGKYKVTMSIDSPEKQNYLLHVDKGSGVEGKFWTKPIEVEWELPYLPKK
ncbi:MAG TPA: iron transporter [Bacillota bacterium]|nr:iron transporter [Bacillota bacterium]